MATSPWAEHAERSSFAPGEQEADEALKSSSMEWGCIMSH